MGLSSSQARLLNLTSRIHDIEYKAQNLEAQKLQMANESTAVYQDYENALNKQKIQLKSVGSDGTATYSDTSMYSLLKSGYIAENIHDNNLMVSSEMISTYSVAMGIPDSACSNAALGLTGKYTSKEEYRRAYFAKTCGGESNPALIALYSKMTSMYASNGGTVGSDASPGAWNSTIGNKAFVNLGTLTGGAPSASDTKYTNTDYLTNMIEAGFIVLNKLDSGSGITETNVATDTNLQEVSDETEVKKAEAKYEASMAKIDAKDKKFDTNIASLDNERTAIKTEIDTLKTVAKDNVDRTFKLFS